MLTSRSLRRTLRTCSPRPAATAASGAASGDLPIAAAPTPPADGGESAGEGGETPAEGGSTPVEPNPPGKDFEPLGSDAERYACTSDADCVLTKWSDGNCCPRLCRTNLALNKDFEAQLATKREASCERNCPVARCAKPTESYAVSCVDNSCVVTGSPM